MLTRVMGQTKSLHLSAKETTLPTSEHEPEASCRAQPAMMLAMV